MPSCFSRAYSNVVTHCKAAAAIGLTSHLGRGTCKFHFYSPSQKTGLLQGRSMALYERNDFVQSCFFFSPSRHRCIIMCRILHHLDLTMENHAAKHPCVGLHVCRISHSQPHAPTPWVAIVPGVTSQARRTRVPSPPSPTVVEHSHSRPPARVLSLALSPIANSLCPSHPSPLPSPLAAGLPSSHPARRPLHRSPSSLGAWLAQLGAHCWCCFSSP